MTMRIAVSLVVLAGCDDLFNLEHVERIDAAWFDSATSCPDSARPHITHAIGLSSRGVGPSAVLYGGSSGQLLRAKPSRA